MTTQARGRGGEVEIKVQPRVGETSSASASAPSPAPSPGGAGGGGMAIRGRARPYKSHSPWLVPAMTVANVVLFLITMYINDCPKHSTGCVVRFLGRFSFQPTKENPLLGPSSATLDKMGALDVNKVVHGHQGWRLITCVWLHAGVVHILANMLCLLLIGIRLEQEFGFLKVGMVYIISGLGGSVLSALFIQSSISVGASGALFGLLGAMLSELLTNWTIYANKCAALLTLIFVIVLNLAIGILPHVDNFAHLGGFISGFLLGFVVLIRPQFGWVSQRYQYTRPGYLPGSASPKSKHNACQYILWIVAAVLLIIGFTVAMVLLFRGVNGNDHCSWCHYLSCVPTSKWSCNSNPVYCESSQDGDMLSLICQGNGRARNYTMPNATDSQIRDLCTQLCT
ncbi:Rhomboid-like protein [Rhynchospora pubera]|uniref:RHOMBOID-like protein n=1 Tax=Rhynchospora pubera TaxID=906938 RepID=A0AAV8F6X9_9POAL|nr:Rhomboid-like protein [Rhynchospora pubera]KAJ4779824.1 Rhomboid-like protein [Rhynchospora pubera]KAJ4786732.1 Rhomboid-like protein [Rhynchospora pubera]